MLYMREKFNEASTNYLKLFLQGKEYRIREDEHSLFQPLLCGASGCSLIVLGTFVTNLEESHKHFFHH